MGPSMFCGTFRVAGNCEYTLYVACVSVGFQARKLILTVEKKKNVNSTKI